jgi:hypothetical protein
MRDREADASLGRSVGSTKPRASSIGSAKLIHIPANRTISARSSGSFMHSASDKHSLAFARYALSAAIGTFSSQFHRSMLQIGATRRRAEWPIPVPAF